jgi:hypothetical protein
VFEHVSEALAVGSFVLGADVVEDADVGDGRGGHGCVDDLEAVVEGFGFVVDAGFFGAGYGGEGKDQEA